VIEETFNSSGGQVATVEPLTYGEENTLLYVEGYICHKLLKITASKHPMRDKCLLCLQDLCDKNYEILSSADWIHAVDSGVGLCVSVKARAHYSNKWHSACHDAGSKKECSLFKWNGTVHAMMQGVKKSTHYLNKWHSACHDAGSTKKNSMRPLLLMRT